MSGKKLVVEVCVDSLESAVAAINGGADRLEVCGCLAVGGGTTPSLGLVRAIKRHLPHVPLMVMIRPRIGDFVYNEMEIETMLEDIRMFKSEDVGGLVFGVLTAEHKVDVGRTSRLVALAKPLDVTFHRAFDMTPNVLEALRSVYSIDGISRILTSGNVGPTMDVKAIGTLAALNNWLKGTRPGRTTLLSILPGSGINQTTAPLLMRGSYDALDPLEIHLSGGHWVSGSVSSQYRKENMGMGVDGKAWDVWKTDESRVRATRDRAEDAIRDELKKGDKNPSLNGSERKA